MRKIFLTSALFVLSPFLFIFSLIAILYTYSPKAHLYTATTVAYAASPEEPEVLSATTTGSLDVAKVEKVRTFLAKYKSPLEPYAIDIVIAAEEYGLDYRFIPAIAMQESGLCKTIPIDSYNCWGFGIYGGKVTRFDDYKEGIYTVTKALAVRYRGQGLVTPEQIMTIYTPNSNGSWAKAVNHFMEQMK